MSAINWPAHLEAPREGDRLCAQITLSPTPALPAASAAVPTSETEQITDPPLALLQERIHRASLLSLLRALQRGEVRRARLVDRKHCRSDKKQLQVHHTRYVRGRMPWEYSDDELAVLCDDCHGLEHLPAPTEEDLRREATIDRLQQELVATKDTVERQQIMAAIQSLVASRSPEQVRRMERDRGLT